MRQVLSISSVDEAGKQADTSHSSKLQAVRMRLSGCCSGLPPSPGLFWGGLASSNCRADSTGASLDLREGKVEATVLALRGLLLVL
jgi:hypothetical protein